MKRTQKYMSSEAHGYLREAEACSLVLKDLEHISAKLQRRIDREAAARQADFEAAMQYHSEAEIQDAYGWEFITEAQYLVTRTGWLRFAACRSSFRGKS